MIFLMVVLGGATRLTGSGLSIMEWAPVSGALPPWSEAEWNRLFVLYQGTPQYRLLNAGFGLEGFKEIFWLEWFHRLWGRLIGVAVLVPLLVFWSTGRFDRRLAIRLVPIFLLGALQGMVGWFMVASGFFEGSTAVSPVRLVLHLTLALLLYAAVFWTAMQTACPADGRRALGSRPAGSGRMVVLAELVCGLVAVTIVAGGFVAGLHAGLDYNTFPLMDGKLVPRGYARLEPFFLNFVANVAAVQFNHRLLASLTAVSALSLSIWLMLRGEGSQFRSWGVALGAAVAVQFALGVLTLVYVVPVPLAIAHQAGAVLVLTAALGCLYAVHSGATAPPLR